jgi:hypothetical protein
MTKETDKAIFVANAKQQLAASGKWGYLQAIEEAIRLRTRHPEGFSTNEILKSRAKIDELYAASSSTSQSPARRYDSDFAEWLRWQADHIGKLGVAGTELFSEWQNGILDIAYKNSRASQSALNAHKQDILSSYFPLRSRATADETLSRAWDLAQADDDFRFSFDASYSGIFNSLSSDSAELILTSNPDLKLQLQQANLLGDVAELITDQDAIKSVLAESFKDQANNIEKSREQIKSSLSAVGKQIFTLQVGVEGVMQKMKDDEEKNRKKLVTEWQRDSLRSIAVIAAQVLGDEKKGKQILGLADAYIAASVATDKFNAGIDALRMGNEIGSSASALGVLGLCSNYVTIGITLVNLFSAQQDGPTNDEIILKGIADLSHQIEEMRKEISQNFNVLDRKIDQIFNAISQGFSSLSDQLMRAEINLTAVRSSLGGISRQIDEFNIIVKRKLDYLIDVEMKTLLTNIDNFKGDHGREMTEVEYLEFIQRLRVFYEESKNSIFTGRNFDEVQTDELFSELKDSFSGGNINYLRGYANMFAGYSFLGSRANPVRVATAAAALIKTSSGNSKAFFKNPISLHKDLLQEIKNDFQERENLLRSNEGSFSKLLEQLFNDYQISISKLTMVTRSIRNEEVFKATTKPVDYSTILDSYLSMKDTAMFSIGFLSRSERFFINTARQTFNELQADHAPQDKFETVYAVQAIASYSNTPDFPTKYVFANYRGFRGNEDFPKAKLPSAISEKILEECPLISIGISLGLVDVKSLYCSFFYPHVRLPYAFGPAFTSYVWDGNPHACFRTSVTVKGTELVLNRQQFYLPTPSIRILSEITISEDIVNPKILRNYSAYTERYMPWESFYQTIEDSQAEQAMVRESEASYAATSLEVAKQVLVVSDLVKKRLISELNDPSTQLYSFAKMVENSTLLIRHFFEYAFHMNMLNINDQLAVLIYRDDICTDLLLARDEFFASAPTRRRGNEPDQIISSNADSLNPSALPLMTIESLKGMVSEFTCPALDSDINVPFIHEKLSSQTLGSQLNSDAKTTIDTLALLISTFKTINGSPSVSQIRGSAGTFACLEGLVALHEHVQNQVH